MPSDTLEIFIYAAVAGYIIYKLYTVLGQKTGFEASFSASVLKDKLQPDSSMNESPPDPIIPLEPSVQKIIDQIQIKDKNFKVFRFLKGASKAFETILEAFAQGKLDILEKLVSFEVYEDFKTTILDRQARQETLETTIVKIESIKIVDANLDDNDAQLTLEIETEQIHVTKDKRGEIIGGQPHQIEQLIDRWVFQRHLMSSNPNWNLIKTEN